MNNEKFVRYLSMKYPEKTIIEKTFDKRISNIKLNEDEIVVLTLDKEAIEQMYNREDIFFSPEERVYVFDSMYKTLDLEELKEYEKEYSDLKLDKFLFYFNKVELEKENRRISEKEYEINKQRIKMMKLANELSELKVKVAGIKLQKEETNRVKDEITKIIENEFVREVTFDDSDYIEEIVMNIHTKSLTCYEPLTDRYYLIPETIIELNLNTGEVKYYCENEEEGIEGYWREPAPHPHVDGCGYPCLGNTSAMIAEGIALKEYYAVFLTTLGFLQTCNIEDIAGYGVCLWNECDKNGNIIKHGHIPEVNEYGNYTNIDYSRNYGGNDVSCEICGEVVDIENSHTCTVCERTLCEDCITYVEPINDYVCKECLENYYVRCDNCGEYYEKDDGRIMYDEENDVFICEDCR